jgi:hypothetical protein
MKWELLRPGGNSPVTVFASDDEPLAFLHLRYHAPITVIIVHSPCDLTHQSVVVNSVKELF